MILTSDLDVFYSSFPLDSKLQGQGPVSLAHWGFSPPSPMPDTWPVPPEYRGSGEMVKWAGSGSASPAQLEE